MPTAEERITAGSSDRRFDDTAMTRTACHAGDAGDHGGCSLHALIDRLYAAAHGRQVDALLANAGRGLGRSFLDQEPADWRRVVDTNITGTLLLIQLVGRDMRGAGNGRILITGSIAGFLPGTFQAVYNGS